MLHGWSAKQLAALHYVSETAAARDIEFIAEHFQQAADDFATITGENIDSKLDVYIIDRIWGNGGFGGNGELVISYTDRYYGPTMGAEGLQTLARHEFTHAAGVGLEQAGDKANSITKVWHFIVRWRLEPDPSRARSCFI